MITVGVIKIVRVLSAIVRSFFQRTFAIRSFGIRPNLEPRTFERH